MTIKLGSKIYQTGKRKSDGMYTIFHKGAIIFESICFDSFKKKINALKNNALKRAFRSEIANICGTSYVAAMRDMGGVK